MGSKVVFEKGKQEGYWVSSINVCSGKGHGSVLIYLH